MTDTKTNKTVELCGNPVYYKASMNIEAYPDFERIVKFLSSINEEVRNEDFWTHIYVDNFKSDGIFGWECDLHIHESIDIDELKELMTESDELPDCHVAIRTLDYKYG